MDQSPKADRSRLRLVSRDKQPDNSLASLSSDELVWLAQHGERGAFDALVQRYQAKLVRIAMRYLADSTLAWDAVQQALAIVLVYRLQQYRFEQKFQAYLFSVLINECRQALRRTKRERALEKRYAEPLPRSGLDESLLAQRAVLQLTPKLRDVVTLRYAGGFSFQEISEVLGIRVTTARRRHFDAMEKLQRYLEER